MIALLSESTRKVLPVTEGTVEKQNLKVEDTDRSGKGRSVSENVRNVQKMEAGNKSHPSVSRCEDAVWLQAP